jgi:glycine cleavage system H protein
MSLFAGKDLLYKGPPGEGKNTANEGSTRMDIPRDLRFTKSHEWIREAEGEAVVGITDFAQEQLSDLTYVELPAPGDEVAQEDEVAVVESVKAASDVYAPLSGQVVDVNAKLADHPELINSDPYGDGWLFRLRISKPEELEELLSADDYEQQLPESE